MAVTLATRVSPGWHKDPVDSAQLRWWDGERWTDYVSSHGVVSLAPAAPTRTAAEQPRPADLPQRPELSAQESQFGHGAPPAKVSPPAGWYREGRRTDVERWWDGQRWSQQYRKFAPRRSALPPWLSVPVLVCAPLAALGFLGIAMFSPVGTLLGLAIAAITALPLVGAFVWLDRLEPEPLGECVHALLWGASVPLLFAAVIGLPLHLVSGGSMEVAAVIGAPISEELGKGLGLLFILRRARIDSIMDGVVYAGWVAAGFALIEDVLYYATSYSEAGLAGIAVTGVLRGGVSLFAHPLMTLPIGVAIGWAVVSGRNPYAWAAVGYVPAVLLHALWNGSAVSGTFLPVYLLLLAPLFLASASLLIFARQRGRATLARQVPRIADYYGLTAQEAAAFASWQAKLRARRSLPRHKRAAFDALHAAVARLSAVQEWKVAPSPEYKQRVVEGLWEARACM